jgi:hypothetical protein
LPDRRHSCGNCCKYLGEKQIRSARAIACPSPDNRRRRIGIHRIHQGPTTIMPRTLRSFSIVICTCISTRPTPKSARDDLPPPELLPARNIRHKPTFVAAAIANRCGATPPPKRPREAIDCYRFLSAGTAPR